MSVRITRSSTGVVTCLLDNPQRRNALNSAMLQTICETFEAARPEDGTRVLVLRGAQGTFCAGRDLRELNASAEDSDASIAERIEPVTRLAKAVKQCAVPTVALIEGKAVGLGVALACWSDLVLAADDAIFQIPEARAGIVPTYTAVSLAQSIGQRQALAICLAGRPLAAAQAQNYGLVHQVCAAAGLDVALAALCQGIIECGPQALSQCKALLGRTQGQSFDAAIASAAELSIASLRSAEALEGMQAVLGKRPPAWAQPQIRNG